MWEKGAVVDLSMDGTSVGGPASTAIGISWLVLSDWVSILSGRISVTSESCLNIRFTAMIPAAPVSALKSAPTYPGVAFAKAVKLKFPSNRNLTDNTCKILQKEVW